MVAIEPMPQTAVAPRRRAISKSWSRRAWSDSSVDRHEIVLDGVVAIGPGDFEGVGCQFEEDLCRERVVLGVQGSEVDGYVLDGFLPASPVRARRMTVSRSSAVGRCLSGIRPAMVRVARRGVGGGRLR